MLSDTTHVLPPAAIGEVQELRPQMSEDVKLTPETKVLCIHRGRTPLEDMFDSQHYVITPGYFSTEYGAAKHFKDRAVVPGSRNPETRKQASFIAIIGVPQVTPQGIKILKVIDHPSQWPAFTNDECDRYGLAVEAIDRAALVDAFVPANDAVLVPLSGGVVSGEASRVTSDGADSAPGRGRSTRIEGTGRKVLKPGRTDENEATRQIRRDTAAAQSGKEDDVVDE